MTLEELVPEAGNLKSFIEQFDVFAGAPGGVDKIREIILQLAITGRLVSASANDEPVRKVISDAKSEKISYEKDFNLRKAKAISSLNAENYPYTIPDHWAWCQLNDLASYIQRGKGPKYTEDNSALVISQKCIQWTGFDISKARGIENTSLEKYGKERFLVVGDLLWNSTGTGTVGRIAIIENTYRQSLVADSHVTVIRLSNVESRYIWFCIACPWVQLRIDPEHENSLVSGSTKQVELSTVAVKELPIPLPPIEEQKRIVSKVDQLMALCDTLEAQQQQQAHTVLRANTAAINALLNPNPQTKENQPETTETHPNTDPKKQFEQNWQRIAQHFNTLYGCTLPMPKGQGRKKKHLVGLENIKALRDVIAKLALNGKLTIRGKDKSISLTKIQESYESWAHTKKPLKIPPISLIERDEKIPKNWIYAQLGNIISIRSGDGLTKAQMEDGNIPVYGGNGVTGFHSKGNIDTKSIVIGRVGYYCGSVHLTEGLAWITDNAFITNYPSAYLSKDFLVLLLKNSSLQQNEHSTAQPVISGKKVYPINVVLPPLEEQKRIVAKVDQLMRLCDQLEQQLTQSYSDAEKLMQATVKALVA